MRSKSGYAWIVVACLWFVWLLNYLDRQAFYSVFPLLRSGLRLSDFQLGLLSTSFLWVYAIASPLAGYLADRFGRKNIIVISLLVWSLMTWATGKARNFQELLWARGLMGVSEAAYLPAGLAMIADYHSRSTRSRATGLHFSGGYLGTVLGGLLEDGSENITGGGEPLSFSESSALCTRFSQQEFFTTTPPQRSNKRIARR